MVIIGEYIYKCIYIFYGLNENIMTFLKTQRRSNVLQCSVKEKSEKILSILSQHMYHFCCMLLFLFEEVRTQITTQ